MPINTNYKCWEVGLSLPLDRIFSWCLANHEVNRMLLTARLDTDYDSIKMLVPEQGNIIESLFRDYLIDILYASIWPGTELIGHKGKVYVLEFNSFIADKMCSVENNLFRWRDIHAPPLPEDICLFREDSKYPNLVSITHEKEAWIISDKIVDLPDVTLVEDDPESLLIPTGKYFCEV